jgi:hypothetical protein
MVVSEHPLLGFWNTTSVAQFRNSAVRNAKKIHIRRGKDCSHHKS